MSQLFSAPLAGTVQAVGDPLAYYSVVATILPVFILAMLYQANLLDESPLENDARIGKLSTVWMGALGTYLVLLLACLGEAGALFVLARRNPSHQSATLVGASVFVTGYLLVWQRVQLALEQRRIRAGQPTTRPAEGLLDFLLLLGLGAGLVLFSIEAG